MHSMYFTRVVIICTYTSGYNTQYTIQTNPTDIYVIMHSCLRMFTGEHVKPVCALREDSCITNTPYIQYIDFLLSPCCALNSLSCWRLIFLRFPPDPSNSVLEKYVPRKIAKNFKKWDHRTQKKNSIFITWLWSWQADVRQCVRAQGGENWVGLLMNKIRSEWVYWKSRERCKKCKQGLCSCHKLHLRRRIRFLRRNIAGASHKYTHTQYWEFDAAKPPSALPLPCFGRKWNCNAALM